MTRRARKGRWVAGLLAALSAAWTSMAMAAPRGAADDPWTPVLFSHSRHEVGAWCSEGAITGDFGEGAIALIGDDLLVASPPLGSTHPGEVGVWRWMEPEGWIFRQRLSAAIPSIEGLVGLGAAIAGGTSASGDWLFVGAAYTQGPVGVGAVAVFRRGIEGDWCYAGRLDAPMAGDYGYGGSLAFDGTRLAVGVARDPVVGDSVQGGADAYTIVDGVIVGPESMWMPFFWPLPGVTGPFGAVGIAGDTLALAGPTASAWGYVQLGLVAIFERHPDGTWVFERFVSSSQPHDYGHFGASIAMSGPLLVGAAPQEFVPLPDGTYSRGTATVIRHEGADWVAVGTILGRPGIPGSFGGGLGSVAIEGDRIVCGQSNSDPSGVEGTASIYRIVEEPAPAIELLARAQATEEFGFYYTSTGERVTVGGGRFAFTRKAESFTTGRWVVRALPLASATTDCDGDGALDAGAVLAGAVPDCDDDLLPDGCEQDCDGDGVADPCATVQVAASAAPLEPGIAYWTTSPERLYVIRAVVPPGVDGVVRGARFDWSTQYSGPWNAMVLVYADPDQDGDPADAALLGAWGTEVTAPAGPEEVSIPPTVVGGPGTSFFVGLAARRLPGFSGNGNVIRAAAGGPQPNATWTAAYSLGGFDPRHPFPNGAILLATVDSSNPNIWCAALFASPLDVDGDGRPDDCQCIGDLDGDRTVGASDLVTLLAHWGTANGGDLDGDGTIGPLDLGLLLAAWGPC